MVSAQVSTEQMEKVTPYRETGEKEGAEVLCGWEVLRTRRVFSDVS
jgi:acyl-CoA reductase-like NAD-dependent aldehyde dehydrogenase